MPVAKQELSVSTDSSQSINDVQGKHCIGCANYAWYDKAKLLAVRGQAFWKVAKRLVRNQTWCPHFYLTRFFKRGASFFL